MNHADNRHMHRHTHRPTAKSMILGALKSVNLSSFWKFDAKTKLSRSYMGERK